MKIVNAAVGGNMILLDNHSTFNIFYAGYLLRIIVKVNHSITIHSNTGSTKTAWMGDIPGFVTLWFNNNGITNILSIAKVKKRYQVTYDSNGSNVFELKRGDGELCSFVWSDRGVFYLDIVEELKNKGEHRAALFQTVVNNSIVYDKRDCLKALKYRKLQKVIGRPITKNILEYIKNKMISNCPVTKSIMSYS